MKLNATQSQNNRNIDSNSRTKWCAFHHCVATFFDIYYQFIAHTSLAFVIYIGIWSGIENINNFFYANKQKTHQLNIPSERQRESETKREKKRTRQIN